MEDTHINCPHCGAKISRVAVICEVCKYPVAGTEREKAIFIGQQTLNISKVTSATQVISRTQVILYIVAAFKILNAFLVYTNLGSIPGIMFYVVIYLIIAVVLGVFSYLLPKKPVELIIASLAVILGYYLLLYFINPLMLYSGFLWKFVIVTVLLYALYTVVESQKIKKKFNL